MQKGLRIFKEVAFDIKLGLRWEAGKLAHF